MKRISFKINSLKGDIEVPGDKSISHRALILSSQGVGISKIIGLLESEDVLNTLKCLRLLGVRIDEESECYKVYGVGVGGLSEPEDILYMGNSGTGVRLLMGLVTPYEFTSFFCGDKSLHKRPMGRVTVPLEKMGASIISRPNGRLPLALTGTSSTLPITYELPVPSAQVKSAILLAALNTMGETTVIEPESTRDHTERMMKSFGINLDIKGNKISLKGYQELKSQEINVPGDPSSAAFLVVAALLVPSSNVTIKNICINKSRIGLYTTLKEMGANIEFINIREEAGEEIADIKVESSKLKGVEVPASRAPSMIDEYPVLSVAASFAEGTTVMRGLRELRVKESDRLSVIAEGLMASGVECRIGGDDLYVTGKKRNAVKDKQIVIKTHMDHRIAMSFLVMGMISDIPVVIDSDEMIDTSFPGFIALCNSLGAEIKGFND